MKIEIIGAGPAGLYFALLAKKHDRSHRITVHEQNPEGATSAGASSSPTSGCRS